MLPWPLAFAVGRMTSRVPLAPFMKPKVMIGVLALMGMSQVSFSLMRLGVTGMSFVPDLVSKMALWSKETAENCVLRLPDPEIPKEINGKDQLPVKEMGIFCGGALLGILWLKAKQKRMQYLRWLRWSRWFSTIPSEPMSGAFVVLL